MIEEMLSKVEREAELLHGVYQAIEKTSTKPHGKSHGITLRHADHDLVGCPDRAAFLIQAARKLEKI